jgi:hypothetical protein
MEEDSDVPKYVKLVSAEDDEFFLERSIAVAHSTTIRKMLEGSFRESHENVIKFPDISGVILQKIIKYLLYKSQHSHSSTRIPEFVIEPEIALELMIAAKFLDC